MSTNKLVSQIADPKKSGTKKNDLASMFKTLAVNGDLDLSNKSNLTP